jgi:ketosteroid isomerase-like protein
MSAEANKAVVRRYLEESTGGRVAHLDEVLAPTYRSTLPGWPPLDREGDKQMVQAFYAGFPDLRPSIEEQLAEGDRVATRVTWRGTHTGTFQGIPPTGRAVTMAVLRLDRIEGGRIAESWAQFDALGVMQQLGVLPAPGQPAG